MAARTRRGTKEQGWSDNVRQRIRTSMLLNRLHDHILGKIKMDGSQVTAALGLLKKAVPDLSAVEMSGTVEQRVIRLPQQDTAQPGAWEKSYAPQQVSHPKPESSKLN